MSSLDEAQTAVCLLKNALQHEIQSEIIQQDSPVLTWGPMMLSQVSILQIPLLSNQNKHQFTTVR